jgi:hypothetical protein
VVVDTLARFLPGGNESNPASLQDFVQPLARLAAEGAAVLVLHHPRKDAVAPRGGRTLRQAFDLHLSLARYSQYPADAARRRLTGRARDTDWTLRLAYNWHRHTGKFTRCDVPEDHPFVQHWQLVESVLKRLGPPATAKELLAAWPDNAKKPSESVLYDWLNRAHADKRVHRTGRGNSAGPYRYCVPG